MRYIITAKSVKHSANALTASLKQKGFTITHHVALELVAKVLHIKNYNTLQALATTAHVIESYQPEKKYIFELTCALSREKLLNLLEQSFIKANAQLTLSNFQSQVSHNPAQGHDFLIEVDMLKNDQNILTAMFLLCETMKKESIIVHRFEYVRVSCEKASMMAYFNTNDVSHESASNTSTSRSRTRPFSELRDKMSPQAQQNASGKAKTILLNLDNESENDNAELSSLSSIKKNQVVSLVLSKMKPHEKALLAVFATQGCNEVGLARMILDKLAKNIDSDTRLPNFKQAQDFLVNCQNNRVLEVLNKFKNQNPSIILAHMLMFARTQAVLAPSLFLWLKQYDQALWKVLNSIGRPSQAMTLQNAGFL